jgi:hypothetical protein
MTTFTSGLLGSGLLATSIALASSLVAANAAQALTLNFDSTSTSTNDPATGASAQVDFDFVDVAGGVQLDLTLLNTTGKLDDSFGSGATDSEFVAFGFDVSESISSYTYDSLSSPFTRLFGDASLNPTVEGSAVISGAGGSNVFDIGIRVANAKGNLTAGGFQGGSPSGGLNSGESAQVSFFLNTTDNAQAVEQAFANLFNGEEFRAVARFQNVNAGEGSDKLLVNRISNGDPDDNGDVSVPEPGTLAGLALIGGSLAAARRRKSC